MYVNAVIVGYMVSDVPVCSSTLLVVPQWLRGRNNAELFSRGSQDDGWKKSSREQPKSEFNVYIVAVISSQSMQPYSSLSISRNHFRQMYLTPQYLPEMIIRSTRETPENVT
jgi:hypothetical protein